MIAPMAGEGTLQPGKTRGGDFVIERPLGSGGMGAVYVARQLSTQRPRAIKTMHARLLSDPTLRARFAREARVSSMIESDHVVEVVGAGIDEESDVPWIAMELLQGDDLARYVAKRGRLSLDEVRAVAEHAGHALAAAHRAGVVHRDLKPANLFLATPRRAGVPFMLKILDFGIAKIVDSQTSKATTNIIGSPLWMAPEQTDASAPIGPWTDVWSFGLIMFWALTGKSYWRAANAAEGSIPAVIRELVVDPMASASERATFLGVGDRVPPGFDAWLARCLQRDVTARFGSAAEAVSALLEVLKGGAGRVASAVPATVAMPQFPLGGGPAALGAMGPWSPTAAPLQGTLAPLQGTLAPLLPSASPPVAPRRGTGLVAAVAVVALAALAGGFWLASARPSAPQTAVHVPAPEAVAAAGAPVVPTPQDVAAPLPAAQTTKPPRSDVPVAADDDDDDDDDRADARRRARRNRPQETPTVPVTPPPDPPPPPPPQRCEVRAGPVWNDTHARQVCHNLCSRAGARRFTGQWHTTVQGVMSVCECEFPAGTACTR